MTTKRRRKVFPPEPDPVLHFWKDNDKALCGKRSAGDSLTHVWSVVGCKSCQKLKQKLQTTCKKCLGAGREKFPASQMCPDCGRAIEERS